MNTLYNLSNEYVDIIYNLEENTSDDNIITQLENINEKFDKKAINIAIIINKLEEESEIIKNEISRLEKRYQTKIHSIERLKKYLKDNMIFCRKNRIETPTHTLTLRTYYKTKVSDDFVKWAITNNKNYLLNKKITYTPNKKMIKEEIENGQLDCPYTQIEETQNILIK